MLFVLYLLDVNVYEDEPVWAMSLTMGWGAAAGIGSGLLAPRRRAASGSDDRERGLAVSRRPVWAAATALIAQDAGAHGVRRLGFVDPTLYAIAARPQPTPGFHDITIGTNRYFPATSGWDFATGLGSQDVANLAQDIVAYLKR